MKYELAGLPVWLPDSSERVLGGKLAIRSAVIGGPAWPRHRRRGVISSVAIHAGSRKRAAISSLKEQRDSNSILPVCKTRSAWCWTQRGTAGSVQEDRDSWCVGAGGAVCRMRAVPSRTIARVVVDLTEKRPYQITHEGDALVVYFQMQATPNAGGE